MKRIISISCFLITVFLLIGCNKNININQDTIMFSQTDLGETVFDGYNNQIKFSNITEQYEDILAPKTQLAEILGCHFEGMYQYSERFLFADGVFDYYRTSDNVCFSITRKNGTVKSWVSWDVENPRQNLAEGEELEIINDDDLLALANPIFESFSDKLNSYQSPQIEIHKNNTYSSNETMVQVEYKVVYALMIDDIKAGGFYVSITGNGKVKAFWDDYCLYDYCNNNNIIIDYSIIENGTQNRFNEIKEKIDGIGHFEFERIQIENKEIKALSVDGKTKLSIVETIQVYYTKIYPDEYIEYYKDKGVEIEKYEKINEPLYIAWLFV